MLLSCRSGETLPDQLSAFAMCALVIKQLERSQLQPLDDEFVSLCMLLQLRACIACWFDGWRVIAALR
jgi:hypothetical protein